MKKYQKMFNVPHFFNRIKTTVCPLIKKKVSYFYEQLAYQILKDVLMQNQLNVNSTKLLFQFYCQQNSSYTFQNEFTLNHQLLQS